MKFFPQFWPKELLIFGYIVAFAFGNLCFKKAGDRSGFWWIWFFTLGNTICFLSTFFETWALAGRNPNVIFAACLGGGFCALQLVSFLVFKTPLSTFQWAGIGLISLGIILLQIKA